MLRLVVQIISLGVVITNSEIISVGVPCPVVNVVPVFDLPRYLGLWYDLQHYPASFQDGICATANYSIQTDGKVQVYNDAMYDRKNTTKRIVQVGEAVLTDPTKTEAKLKVTFVIGPVVTRSDYWVLSTDYSSYSVVWSCSDRTSEDGTLAINSQSLWVLSREKQLSSKNRVIVDEVIKMNKLNPIFLTAEDKQDCNSSNNIIPGSVLIFIIIHAISNIVIN